LAILGSGEVKGWITSELVKNIRTDLESGDVLSGTRSENKRRKRIHRLHESKKKSPRGDIGGLKGGVGGGGWERLYGDWGSGF